ncbi:TonB-dependent receptor domain-containing protein [Woodsholea maritima]|uniref:TonB-dependent receptor domain-containing protein n=1 Tax=Woodsholea maritima TaxID=240237 RepID=UPI000381A8C4|nr:TonB-dependent receptor [Woodsholea maritima]
MSIQAFTRNVLLSGSAVCAVMAAPAFAQSNEAPDIIEVWGTQIQSSSLYMGEEEIGLKQADHLSDLLRDIPGVDIGGTHSVNQRINFRGLDDRNINVFIDGALQTNYMFHHMGNLLINADILKSADIQLGANSVVNGGIGGAIRFETKDARDLLDASENPFGGRVMVGYNTNAQHSYSLTGYGQLGERFDVLGYFNQVDRDNFEDGDGVDTIGSDGTTQNTLIKVGFDLSANQRFELSYDNLEDEGDYTQRPDMGVRTNKAITGDLLIPTEYTRTSWNAGYELDLGEALSLRATYYTNDLSLYRDQRATITRSGPGKESKAFSNNYGVNILAQSVWNQGTIRHDFTYGLEYFNQELNHRADLSSTAPATREEGQSLAIFAQDEITFANGIIVRPGVRYHRFEQEIFSTKSSDSWDDVTFALAGEFPVTEELRFLASYTELFKAPELAEAFVGGAANKIINPDLEPEGGDNIELGVRYSTMIGEGSLNLGANVFRQRITNYIGEVPVPGSTTGEEWDENRGELKLEGFEASAHYGLGAWDFLATYSHSDADDKKLTGSSGDSLREIGDQLGLNVAYTFTEHDIVLDYTVQVVMDQSVEGAADKKGYDVHNLSARWNEPFEFKGLSVLFGVDNLFNETYTSHASRVGESNHPVFGHLVLNDVEPGRNVKISLSQRF